MMKWWRLRRAIVEKLQEEEAVGVIELVLVLVVLIGLVAVFKTQINELMNTIFGTITSLSNEVL